MRYIVLLLLAFSTTVRAETFEPTKGRTIVLTGDVDMRSLLVAGQIVRLGLVSKEPIDILIDSPGGDVRMGNAMIQAIEFTKKLNVDVRCVNVGSAMSMAFMVLMHCSHHYALEGSTSMFHFPRVMLQGYFSSGELTKDAEMVRKMEDLFVHDLAVHLNRAEPLVRGHCEDETEWSPKELNQFSPGFYTIVDGIQGVDLSVLFQ